MTTITAENPENSLNSVPHTIENIQFKNWEILTYCKANLALFSSVTAIVAPILLIALTLNAKRQQLTAHKSIVKGSASKCYKDTSFFHHALLCSLVLQTQLGASHKIKIS